MKCEWTTKKLSEIADFSTGKLNSNAAVDNGKYPFFTCAPEPLKIDTYNFDEKAIILAGNNAEGNFHISFYEGKFNAYQRTYIITSKSENVVDTRYLYYALKLCLSEFKVISQGTTTKFLTARILSNFEIILPVIYIQKKIAAILSALDEKIAINRAINENLEQQALALFRQYFVDFAPYGGFAPSDWTEVSLDDVCTRITDGSHYSPADAPESPYPMYSVKDMETYGFNFSSCKHITEEDFRKMQKGDCVPLLNEAILSSIAIFRPDTNIIMPEILLYLLKQPSVRKDVGDNYVSGSALPRIVLKDFKKYRFMLPPMDEQAKIGSVLHSIRMQTKANVDEIQRLSSLRDTLLPRLMSGKLDVSDLDL